MNTPKFLTPIILSFLLLLSNASHAQLEEQAEAETQQLKFRASDNFALALNHLEGATNNLSVVDLQQRIQSWTQTSDALINSKLIQELLRHEGIEKGLTEFDLAQVLEILGANNLNTYALGVEKTNSGWIQRSFLGMDGQAKGLFALSGTENQPWQATQFARKDAELILECSLDTKQLANLIQESTTFIHQELFPPETREVISERLMIHEYSMLVSGVRSYAYFYAFEFAMEYLDPTLFTEPNLFDNQSIVELLREIDQVRFSIIVKFPPAKDLTELLAASAEEDILKLLLESGASLTATLDSETLSKLLDVIQAELELIPAEDGFENIEEMLAELEPTMTEEGFEFTKENGLTTFRAPLTEILPEDEFPEGALAQLGYDQDSKTAFLELGMASAHARGSIAQSEDFLASTQFLPKEGTNLAWFSANAIDSLYAIIKSTVEDSDDESEQDMIELLMPLLNQLYGLPTQGEKRGFARASSWVDGGYLKLTSSPSLPADSSIFGIYTQASLLAALQVYMDYTRIQR